MAFNRKRIIEEIKEIKKSIENENVSYGEIAFLENHKEEIKEFFADDVELWQWAGISGTEWLNKHKC